MWRLADQQLDEFVADGHCEFISAYAQPFAMLVVADLLGVPEEDHQRFREGFGLTGTVGEVGAGDERQPGREPAGVARRARSPSTSRTAGASPARTCSPTSRSATYPDGTHAGRHVGRAHRDVPVRRRPGDDRPAARRRAEAPRRAPRAAGRAARRPRADPRLPRGGAAGREPGEGRLPPRPAVDDDRRRRHRGRHAGDAAERRRQPRPAALRVPGTSSASTAPTPRPTSRSGAAPTRAPAAPLARAEGRVSLERILDRMRDIRLVRGAPRPARRPPLRLRADVDPARPHRAAPRVRRRSRQPDEPRRGRHRRRVGHRARRRPAARRPTGTGSRSSTATARRAEAAADELRADGATALGGRGRRRRPRLGRRRASRGCAPSSARSRSS